MNEETILMDEQALPHPPKPVTKSRLTVVETVYFQHPDSSNPTSVESRFYRDLDSDEQSYQRYLRVTEEWQYLNAGWLDGLDISCLVMANSPPKFMVQPTEEERRIEAAKVVEIRQGLELFAYLLQGETMRFSPANVANMALRCRKGETKCVLNLIPI